MKKEYNPKLTPWQIQAEDFPLDGTWVDKLRFLLNYAILAPSSHNTQPWRFAIWPNEIGLFVDNSRWLKVADPDRRELYISLGCALENLLIAAEHFGYSHQTHYCPEPNNDELAVVIKLTPRQPNRSPFREPALFLAISERHTNHKVYKERPLPQADLDFLQFAAVEEGIHLYMTCDVAIKRQVDQLVIQGDALRFANPAWREELGYWMGQGVFGATWLMSKLTQLAVTYVNMGQGTAKKDSELLMSAPVLAVLASETNDRSSQIKVGQIFERISLRAQSLGIRVQPMSQVLQIPGLKAELAKLLPVPDLAPQHTFRLGYAEPEPEHTPRRLLEEVII
jgi:nitroreductase